MALFPVSPGLQPLGVLDLLNTQGTSLLGGEVMTLGTASRTNTLAETAAADALDGYTFSTTQLRPVAQLATAATTFVALSDEGTGPNYFTVGGTIVGGNTGKVIKNGTVIGPHTAAGSGKVTLWDKPGLYEVTLDALVSTFVSGLTPSVGLTPGSVLGYTNVGKLSHSTGNSAVPATGCAVFVEFTGNSSLVTTPAYLVGARAVFDRIKVEFLGPSGSGRAVPAAPI